MKRYREDEIKLQTIRHEADRAATQDAEQLVDVWNAQLAQKIAPQFTPTIGAAVRARKPFLKIHCPGCQQTTDIDLRKIVRPADFAITSLRATLVCETLCRGQGPRPELVGLVELPDETKKINCRDRA